MRSYLADGALTPLFAISKKKLRLVAKVLVNSEGISILTFVVLLNQADAISCEVLIWNYYHNIIMFLIPI